MGDDTKVVDLAGRPLSHRTAPVTAIVELLEKLLAQARAGDTRGLAVAVVEAEQMATLWAYDPTSSMKFELLAVSDLLHVRILKSLEEQGTDK